MFGEEDRLQAAEDEISRSRLMNVFPFERVGDKTKSGCRRLAATADRVDGNLLNVGVERKRGEEDVELIHEVVQIDVKGLALYGQLNP